MCEEASFSEKKVIGLEVALSFMEGGRKLWGVGVKLSVDEDSTQQTLRNTPGSQSTLNQLSTERYPKQRAVCESF